MRHSYLAVLITAAIVAGCGGRSAAPAPASDSPSAPAPAPAVPPPNPTPVAAPITADPAPGVKLKPWVGEGGPLLTPTPAPLTANLPTFLPEPRKPWVGGKQHVGGVPDLAVLGALTDQLTKTGDPTVPSGVHAQFLTTLEGNRYVYDLGSPHQVNDPSVVILAKEGDQWSATPICPSSTPAHNFWVVQPVFVCGTVEGSGEVLTLMVYKGDQQVLKIREEQGIPEFRPRQDAPPDVTITGKLQWMDHKLDPAITERVTYSWQNGAYAVTRHERMSDSAYHLARFDALLAAGDIGGAARETNLPGDLAEYLKQNAPDLQRLAGQKWTTEGITPPGSSTNYLHTPRTEGGPWFRFTFTTDGLIASITQQADRPK